MKNLTILAMVLIAFFVVLVFGYATGSNVAFNSYCTSVGYSKATLVDGEYYCIDSDNPEAVFYVEWQ